MSLMKIAHISDLHLTGKNFVVAWGNYLLNHLNTMRPDIVIITGDMTEDGYLHEYERVKQFVDGISARKLIVPGNHDARNKGYEIFEEFFETRTPFFENDSVTIVGVDSSEPDIDDGHIGRENYDMIKEAFSTEKITILALHHHVIPIPGTGRERNILRDAGDVLKLCVEANIDIVLSGHKHMPWTWKLENSHFVTAGTACSSKLKGRSYPSFNFLRIVDGKIEAEEVNTVTGNTKTIFEKEQ